MSQIGTIGLWLREYEQAFEGSARKAAAHFNIDPAYWWRLRSGEATNPSKEVLDKLGLREAATLYQKA